MYSWNFHQYLLTLAFISSSMPITAEDHAMTSYHDNPHSVSSTHHGLELEPWSAAHSSWYGIPPNVMNSVIMGTASVSHFQVLHIDYPVYKERPSTLYPGHPA